MIIVLFVFSEVTKTRKTSTLSLPDDFERKELNEKSELELFFLNFTLPVSFEDFSVKVSAQPRDETERQTKRVREKQSETKRVLERQLEIKEKIKPKE